MKLKIKTLTPEAQLPYRARITDQTWDLFCTKVSADAYRGVLVCETGLEIELPEGYVGILLPLEIKRQHPEQIFSTIIEAHKEIVVHFKFEPKDPLYSPGEKICRLLVIKAEQIEWNIQQSI